MDPNAEQGIPVVFAEALGQRHGATRDPLMGEALAYVSMCSRLWLETGDMPGKMEGTLQHACNYIGVRFEDAVNELRPDYDEDDDLDE